jgi:DNA-binding NtrC family response regulator
LDEIFNMPLNSQVKLLRVLQEKKIYRLGGIKALGVNVRILATSNQDIHGLALSGTFRRDLFYRLSEFTITVPALRERKEDILYLAKRFLDSTNIELNKHIKGFSDAALNLLLSYNWPGNVRQLRSVIRRASLLSDEMITEKDIKISRPKPGGLTPGGQIQGTAWKDFPLKAIVQQKAALVEREVLVQVLKTTRGNKARAARLLQVGYKTIHDKTKKLGIQELPSEG